MTHHLLRAWGVRRYRKEAKTTNAGMNLTSTMHSKGSRARKATCCKMPFTRRSGKGKTKGQKTGQWLLAAGERRKGFPTKRKKGNTGPCRGRQHGRGRRPQRGCEGHTSHNHVPCLDDRAFNGHFYFDFVRSTGISILTFQVMHCTLQKSKF